jgi:hypothetical protein
LNANYSCCVPFSAGWRSYLALIQYRGDSARGSARELGEDRTQLLSAFLGLVAVLDALCVQSAQLDAPGEKVFRDTPGARTSLIAQHFFAQVALKLPMSFCSKTSTQLLRSKQ